MDNNPLTQLITTLKREEIEEQFRKYDSLLPASYERIKWTGLKTLDQSLNIVLKLFLIFLHSINNNLILICYEKVYYLKNCVFITCAIKQLKSID